MLYRKNGLYIDKNTKQTLKVANKINVNYKKGDIVKIVSEKKSTMMKMFIFG